MTLLDYSPPVVSPTVDTLTAVLCGSFRRDPVGLRSCFAHLSEVCVVLSPTSVEFVDENVEFVRLPDEVGQPEHAIEERHLDSLKRADFVWLFAPDGHVGVSAAMELGHAWALGVPVFSSQHPTDPVIAAKVTHVDSPTDVGDALLGNATLPGHGLERLQHYYRTTAQRRGWSNESARDTLLLLTEELGELARSVRKLEGLARHQPDAATDVRHELADMQLYLVHLANGLGLDLAQAVTDKERINAHRFERARVA